MVKLQVFLKLVGFLCCMKLSKGPDFTAPFQNPAPPGVSELCFYVTAHPLQRTDTTNLLWLDGTSTNKKSELMGSHCLVILPFKAGWQPRVWFYSLADTGCYQSEENKAWDCKKNQLISELGLEENHQSAHAGLYYSLSLTAVRMEGRNSFSQCLKILLNSEKAKLW